MENTQGSLVLPGALPVSLARLLEDVGRALVFVILMNSVHRQSLMAMVLFHQPVSEPFGVYL